MAADAWAFNITRSSTAMEFFVKDKEILDYQVCQFFLSIWSDLNHLPHPTIRNYENKFSTTGVNIHVFYITLYGKSSKLSDDALLLKG